MSISPTGTILNINLLNVCFSKKQRFFMNWIFQWIKHPAASVNIHIRRCQLFSMVASKWTFLRILAFVEELNTKSPGCLSSSFIFLFYKVFPLQDKCIHKQDQQALVRYYLKKLFWSSGNLNLSSHLCSIYWFGHALIAFFLYPLHLSHLLTHIGVFPI